MTINIRLHQTLLCTAAVASVARPIFEYYICPKIKGYNDYLDTFCKSATIATSLAPVAIGSYFGVIGLSQQHSIQSFMCETTSNALKLVLPAGLGMITAQLYTDGKEVPFAAFAIGTAKSSCEITTIGAIMKTINDNGALGDLMIQGFTVSNPVLYGGLVSIAVAGATNTINYIGTSLIQGKELNQEMLTNATDYALGYSVARPLYQVGTHFLNNEEKLAGTICMFSAPILRGYTLGALGKGSVTVPGSDHGVLSNIIDGAGIATASLSRSELGKHITDLDIEPGYIVTATLLSAITAHKVATNHQNITEALYSLNDNAKELLGMNDHVEEL